MIVVMFGSRSWRDFEAVEAQYDRLLLEGDGSLVVVTGAHACPPRDDPWPAPPSSSADAIADWVGRRRGLLPIRVPARWGVHDREGAGPVPCRCPADAPHCRAAGFRRNQLMVDEHLWPFVGEPWDETVHAVGFRAPGDSPGTDDMARRLVAAGIPNRKMVRATTEPPPERRRPRPAPSPLGRFDLWPA